MLRIVDGNRHDGAQDDEGEEREDEAGHRQRRRPCAGSSLPPRSHAAIATVGASSTTRVSFISAAILSAAG